MLRLMILCALIASSQFALSISGTKAQIFPKTVYSKQVANQFSGQHILVNVYLPKAGSQDLLIEIKNNDRFQVGLLEFDLSTFKNFGTVEIGSIPSQSVTKRIFKVGNTRGLKLQDFTVFDSDANERFPNLLVQFIRP